MPGQSIQDEVKKIVEAIKTLEKLRGKIPDDQLEKALSGYKKQLQSIAAYMKAQSQPKTEDTSAAGSQRSAATQTRMQTSTGEDYVSSSSSRRIMAGSAAGEAYQIYQSFEGKTRLSKDEFQHFLGHYLHWFDQTYGGIHLYGLESLSPEASQLAGSMKDVFVPLTFHELDGKICNEIERRAAERFEKPDRVRTFTHLADEQINREESVLLPGMLNYNERIVVIGPAGSGKTTLLSYFGHHLASNILTGKLLPFALPGEKNVLIPLIIPFGKYWEYLEECERQEAESSEELPEGEESGEANPEHVSQPVAVKKGESPPVAAEENSSPGSAVEETAAGEDEYEESGGYSAVDLYFENFDVISGTLSGFIITYLKECSEEMGNSRDFFTRMLKGGSCLLMLDGLDEVRNSNQRTLIKTEVEELINEIYPGNLVIATCREVGLTEQAIVGRNFSRLYIQPINAKQTNYLVSSWCRRINPRQATILIENICTEIENINNRYLQENKKALVRTPLMVDLIICLRLISTEWPLKPARLLESLVRVVIQTHCLQGSSGSKADWGGSWEDVQNWLSMIAFRMHKRGSDCFAITAEQLEGFLDEQVETTIIKKFVIAVRLCGILFQECAEVFSFFHHSMQEFMAARYIVWQKKEIFEQLEYEVSNPWWRNVLLIAYNLSQNENLDFAKQFMDWLTELHLPGLELAGAFVLESENPSEKLRSEIAKRLSAVLSDKAIGAMPIHRAFAGKTLSRLGDPRFQENFWYLPNDSMLGFIKVPGGKYLIGSNPELNQEVSSKEVPMHELAMVTYYIGCYPVTVAQFRTFVRESKYEPINRQSLQGLQNHPVVNVTWDDAMAYCRWLKWRMRNWDGTPEVLRELIDTDDWKLTLPNEPEWECAAHGPRTRPYPWGQKFEPKYANTLESEIGTTTAVGIFPSGESPYHVMDMSGNVWEWTRSIYRIYYYNSADGREDQESRDFRVLRGGSYLNRRFYARCAYRNMYYRDFLAENIGFRVVIHQSHEYEEKETEIEVPVEEVDDEALARTVDENGMVKVKRKVLIRKRVVTAGPKMDR